MRERAGASTSRAGPIAVFGYWFAWSSVLAVYGIFVGLLLIKEFGGDGYFAADRAVGYGMHGGIVDGNDLLAVRDAVGLAAARARAGQGPTLLEFKTFRMRGHEEASGTAYVPPEMFREWTARDPILRFEARLDERRVLGPDQRAALRAQLKAVVDRAVDEALAAPEPSSTPEREVARRLRPEPAEVTVVPARRRRRRRDALRRRHPRRPAPRRCCATRA